MLIFGGKNGGGVALTWTVWARWGGKYSYLRQSKTMVF